MATCPVNVVFEFVGGPRDGDRQCGSLVDEPLTEAAALYRHTAGAQIGKRVWVPCEYSLTALRTIPWDSLETMEAAGFRFQGHLYEIFVRWQRQWSLVVRARHVGASE